MVEDQQLDGAPALGTVIAGRYRLLRFLGAGGMGAVYEAEGPMGRVALKVLLRHVVEQGDRELVERFERESAVTSTLDNPHVVSALGSGVDPALGVPYLVLPLLVGLDLAEHVARNGPLHPIVAVRIVRQACQGLIAAHARGIVHRDIKSANVFLDHGRDGRVTVRILDFGIAKWRDAGAAALTQTGTVLGSPFYMSPEQLKNSKGTDERSDLWSLGITLYEALSGTVPFAEKQTLTDLLLAIASEPAPWIQDIAPWVDPRLARLVHGALVHQREERCPTVAEWAHALQPFAIGSDDVNAAMLVPLQPQVRAQVAVRDAAPAKWLDVAMPRPGEGSMTNVGADDAEIISGMGSDTLIGATIAGRYTLLCLLGSGGMGAVYEATDPAGDRVAVKVLDPHRTGSSEARARFLREARAAASIEDEHVVRVIEAGTDPDRELPFIVMELLKGADLGMLIDHHGALAIEPVARLFRQACRGLAAAHAQGLVHRDIKPANLFLHERPSGELVLKICDFGIAKQLTADGHDDDSATHLTRTGGVMGSPAYMSPEQAKSAKHVDHRTDIWSLGAALYQTLTGVSMWQGKESVGEIIVAICTEPIPNVQDRAPWVPAELADIVHRMVQRPPESRFASVEELAQALHPFAGGDDSLRAGQLGPVSEAARSRVAARTHSAVAASAERTSMSHELHEPKPRSHAALIGGMALLVSVSATATWFAMRGEKPAPAVVEAPTATSTSPMATTPMVTPAETAAPADPRFETSVTIVPDDAEVKLDGEPVELAEGELALGGNPGDSFELVASAGGREVRQTVVITKDGKASPNRVEVSSTAGAGVAKPGGTPRPAGAAGPPPAAAPPKPASSQKGPIEASDEWR